MLRGDELEGIPPEESGGRGWKIPMHPIHDRDRPARVECPSAPPESPERLSDLKAESQDLRCQFGLSRANLAVKCATHNETDAVGRADLGLRRPPSAGPVARMDALESACDTNGTCRLRSW